MAIACRPDERRDDPVELVVYGDAMGEYDMLVLAALGADSGAEAST